MHSLRVLDRFLPSEAYLLTLLAAHHLEMIREEQLLTYLDRGMGIANRDARTALLESALLRANEIDELDHYLERKLERGPREFRAICRSMFTPGVERVLRSTRNEDARRLTLDTPITPTIPVAGSGGNGSGVAIATDWDEEPDNKPKPQSHPWIKAAIAIGLLLMVALAVVRPMDKEPTAGIDPTSGTARYVQDLYSVLVHQDAVIAQLTKDPNLEEFQRTEALRFAKYGKFVSQHLNLVSWNVVRTPGGAQNAYERSFELAVEAYRLAPELGGDRGLILNTVGVAQYRLGHYQEALRLLSQSYSMNKNGVGEQPADVAFLCMCYAHLGRPEEAREQFILLKQLMKTQIRRDEYELEREAFLKEATEVMKQTHPNKVD